MNKLNTICILLAGLSVSVACSATVTLPVGATVQVQPIMKTVHAITTADDFYQLGRYHQNQQHWTKALDAYRSVLEIERNHLDARNRLGAIYAFQGKFNDAVDEFSRALSIAPDSAASHNNLGHAFVLQERYLDAVGAFENAIALDAVNVRIYNNLGQAYRQLGQLEKSYQAFAQAEQLHTSPMIVSFSNEKSFLDGSRYENSLSLNDPSWDIELQNNDGTIAIGDANQEVSSITLHNPEDLLLKVDYRLRRLPIETLHMTGVLQWQTVSTNAHANHGSSDTGLLLKLSLPLTVRSESKETAPSGHDTVMLEPLTSSSFIRDRAVRRRYPVVQRES